VRRGQRRGWLGLVMSAPWAPLDPVIGRALALGMMAGAWTSRHRRRRFAHAAMRIIHQPANLGVDPPGDPSPMWGRWCGLAPRARREPAPQPPRSAMSVAEDRGHRAAGLRAPRTPHPPTDVELARGWIVGENQRHGVVPDRARGSLGCARRRPDRRLGSTAVRRAGGLPRLIAGTPVGSETNARRFMEAGSRTVGVRLGQPPARPAISGQGGREHADARRSRSAAARATAALT